MRILHGENIVQSRNELARLMQQATTAGVRVVRQDAKSLDLPRLEQLFGATSLFGEARLVIIEELHSLPKSKRKDELIEKIAEIDSPDLVLWEKRSLTPTMLKKFSGAQVTQFKLSSALFTWLEQLSGAAKTPAQKTRQLELLRAALASDGDFMCLAMLARQVRFLLQVRAGESVSLAPFMLGKLHKQAETFTQEQLLQLHRQLLKLDFAEKTSQSPLGLARELELWLLNV